MSIYKGNNLISGAMPNSANQSLSNLDSAGQDKFDEKVNKSGDTMTGGLDFNVSDTDGIIKFVNSVADRTSTPASNIYSSINVRDKNNIDLGLFNTSRLANGAIVSILRAYNPQNTSDNDYADLRVIVDANGNKGTYAPASDFINSILTTVGISKSLITSTPNLSLGNGIKLCWGYHSASASSQITFPVTFSAGDSYICLAFPRSGNAYGRVSADSASKSTISWNTSVSYVWFAIGY